MLRIRIFAIMSSSSKKKGKFGSKEIVQCGYCDDTKRKDNLARHIESKHPGKAFKFIHLKCPDGIDTFFKSVLQEPETGNGNKTICDEEGQNENTEIQPPVIEPDDSNMEGGDEEGDMEKFEVRIDSSDIGPENESRKRKRDSSDNLSQKTKKQMVFWNGNDIDEKLESLHSSFIEQFENLALKVENVTNLLQPKSSMNKNLSVSNCTAKKQEEYEHLTTLVTNSTDIESLEKALVDLKILRVDTSPIECFYYCGVCLEGNVPLEKPNNIPGFFTFNRADYDSKIIENPGKQPKSFTNLKRSILQHVHKNNIHLKKIEEDWEANEEMAALQSRSKKIGLNLFRLRYTGIKQAKPMSNFTDDVLTAKLNGTDVGNINHSTFFVKDLDNSIYETMKDDLRVALETVVPSTNQKRPLGMVMDKMTPSKRTGQVHAIIVPVPENPLSQPLLVPLMLDVPIVKGDGYDADGLSKMAKKILNDAGAEDQQLEGIGWDGEYVKKGVKAKFMGVLSIDNWTDDQKDRWITSVWEPAHELELAMKDLRKESIFEWHNKDVNLINEAVGMLNIGKGLQQSIETAERLGLKHYKLRNMSDTRFVAYWGGCLVNFEKDLQISIEVLKVTAVTASKSETREKAARVMKRIQTQEFMLLNLGLIDIYQDLGETSKKLQKVEQFPWDIPKIQESLLKNLQKRSEIKLADEDGNCPQDELDGKLWPALKKNMESVISCQYKGLASTIFSVVRRGRSSDDLNFSTLSLRTTVQNKLSSFCRVLASKFDVRVKDRSTHTATDLIESMSKCLDINEIIEKGNDDEDFNTRGNESIKELLDIAQYKADEIDQILIQYNKFKSALKKLNTTENHYTKLFEFLLYKRHECRAYRCNDKCNLKDHLEVPKRPIAMKFLHLFLREKELYQGNEMFLHFLLRCTMKTHAEGVAESMGSVIDTHIEKRRGLNIEEVGKESIIHWNGPPIHLSDSLGEKALNRHFKGRPWHFVKKYGPSQSTVVNRLLDKNPRVPFF